MSRMDTKQLKLEARCALTGKHRSLALITLLITALDFALSMLASAASPSGTGAFSLIIYICCSLLVEIVFYILLAGMYHIYLNLCRDNPFRWTDLFSAFREHPEPVAIYAVLQYFLTFAFTQICSWFLSCLLALIFNREIGSFLLSLFVTAVVVVIYAYLKISFSMVLFVHADMPWLSFSGMLRTDWQMISGVRLRYLYLQITFIGMYLLALLSFGIGFLFVRPYIRTAEGLFYRKISGR